MPNTDVGNMYHYLRAFIKDSFFVVSKSGITGPESNNSGSKFHDMFHDLFISGTPCCRCFYDLVSWAPVWPGWTLESSRSFVWSFIFMHEITGTGHMLLIGREWSSVASIGICRFAVHQPLFRQVQRSFSSSSFEQWRLSCSDSCKCCTRSASTLVFHSTDPT